MVTDNTENRQPLPSERVMAERFAQVDALKARLDSHRPLDVNRVSAVREKFRIEWTYHSNAIEGSSMTLSETAFFLREGLTSKGKPLSEYLEAKNHAEALDYLEEVVAQKHPLTERLIKDFHTLVMQDTKFIEVKGLFGQRVKKRVEPGAYKYDDNHVIRLDGTIHYFCDYLQVPGEMERLIGWYEEQKERLHPIELAARFHHKLVAIHPFTDGNGRVARLIMNLILMQQGYTPAIIRMEDREEYYKALEAADGERGERYVSVFEQEGDYGPLIEIVEREVVRTLTLTLGVAEGRNQT